MPPLHLTVITGASRGMGLAMARQRLSPQGVLLCISRQTSAELEAEAVRTGATLLQWSQDLADTSGARARLLQWLQQQDPRGLASATLVNNAGVIPRIGPLDQCPPDQLANALRVGLEAPMQLTAGFLQATAEWVAQGWRGPRKVLNISSGLGRAAMAAQAPYCAAKAGMDHFTRCVALEQEKLAHGARVCSLAPGVIDTDMQIQLRSADPKRFPDMGNFVGMKEKGILSTPSDAAAKVLGFLQRADFGSNPVADVRDA